MSGWARFVAAVRSPRSDRLIAAYFLVALAIARAGRMEERDPYWQVRAGLENLAGVPLARPDTWSWAPVGGDWYPNSPGWNVLLGSAFGAAGFAGFFLVAFATVLALLVLVYVLSRRLGSRPLPGLLGLMAAFTASFPMLNVRATTLVQALILAAILFATAWAGVAAGHSTLRCGVVVGLVSLATSVLGNWMHLSFLVIGPGLAVVWALVWWLWPGLKSAKRWVMTLAGLAGWCAGPLLSPYGLVDGLARSAEVQRACEGLISEWSSPLDPRAGAQPAIMLLSALALAALAAWYSLRRLVAGRRDRATIELTALCVVGVPAALAGVLALRFVGVSLLALAPVAGLAMTQFVDRVRRRQEDRPAGRLREYTSGAFWRPVLAATAVLLLPGVVYLGSMLGRPAESDVVAQLPAGCRLFSTPGTAGSVVLLRPDVPIWMDGRADYFGRDRLVLTTAYFTGSRDDPVPNGTTCILLDRSSAPASSLLSARLATSPLWRLAQEDGQFQVWLPVR